MSFDREGLLRKRQELAAQKTKDRPRYPFGNCRTSVMRPGEYTIRLAPPRAGKNPKGYFIFNTRTIPDVRGFGTKQMLLHPESLLNPNGPEAYWGLEHFIESVQTETTEDGDLIYDTLQDDLKQYVKDLKKDWPRIQIPCFISAEPVPAQDVVDKNGKVTKAAHPDYPDYAPARKKIDVVWEIPAQSALADKLIDILCMEDIDVFDSKYGYELLYNNRNPKQPTLSLGRQVPLSSEQEIYLDNHYPDLYENAKKGNRYLSPALMKDLIEKTPWWKYFAKMGFELEEPQSSVDAIKVARKKPKVEEEVVAAEPNLDTTEDNLFE